jgi:hypothetical protein
VVVVVVVLTTLHTIPAAVMTKHVAASSPCRITSLPPHHGHHHHRRRHLPPFSPLYHHHHCVHTHHHHSHAHTCESKPPSGCKRPISDATLAQTTQSIVWARGKFFCSFRVFHELTNCFLSFLGSKIVAMTGDDMTHACPWPPNPLLPVQMGCEGVD